MSENDNTPDEFDENSFNDAVEKLEDNRVVLKEGTPLPVGLGNKATMPA